tara:strand:+ start:41780 stop:42004 length:225 start_codon:yes stop_codon:yes gene_type:complete
MTHKQTHTSSHHFHGIEARSISTVVTSDPFAYLTMLLGDDTYCFHFADVDEFRKFAEKVAFTLAGLPTLPGVEQ